MPNTYERFDYSGANVSEYLKLLLEKKGYNFYNFNEFRLINEIKENSCFCLSNNLNIDNDAKKRTKQKSY